MKANVAMVGHGANPDSGASGYPWPSASAILGPLGAVPKRVEDLGLLLAGALTAAVALIRDRRAPASLLTAVNSTWCKSALGPPSTGG